jgi:hypothetical protein
MADRDPLDKTAISLFAAAAEIDKYDYAKAVFDASDPQIRSHYRRLAFIGPFVHADAHFRMGTGHNAEGSPCQDFATFGNVGGVPYAVVSDGCSSGGRTDLGARLLAMTAARTIADGLKAPQRASWGDGDDEWSNSPMADRKLLVEQVIAKVLAIGDLTDLRQSDMEATLGVVHALPGGRTRAALFGDGLVVARRLNGSMDVHTVDWAGNMPGYPWYMRSDQARKVFVDQSEALARDGNRAACIVTHHRIDASGVVVGMRLDEYAADKGLDGFQFTYEVPAEIDSLAVMTDGALQVSGLGWQEVVSALASFGPARAGEFVRRRMTRGLALLAKENHRPVDDIAVAAIARAVA